MAHLVSYTDFRKGLNDTSAPDSLHDGELVEADNIDLSERGGFSTRKGVVKFNETSYDGNITQLFEWTVKGVNKLIAVIDKKLYVIAEDGTKTEKKVILSDKIAYVFIQHKMYFTDTDNLYEWEEDTIKAVVPNSGSTNNIAPIKKCTMLVQHPKSLRIFAAGNPADPTALYYSEYNDITYFKETNVLYPTRSEGNITKIVPFAESLLVSYNNSWWRWNGIDPSDDASWEQLPIPYGCLSSDTLALTPYSITFLGNKGIYTISASLIAQTGVIVNSKDVINNIAENKIENIINSITDNKKTVGLFHSNKYYIAYNDDSDSPYNNKIVVFDWNIGGFTRYTGIESNCFCPRNNGDLLIAGRNYILKYGEGHDDIDVLTGEEKPIHVKAKTKHYNFGLDMNRKFLYNLYVMFKQYLEQEAFINITLVSDYQTLVMENVDIADSLIWYRSWGKIWGYTDYIQKYAEVKRIASRFQVIFENNRLNDPITVYGVGFEFKKLRPMSNKIQDAEGLLR